MDKFTFEQLNFILDSMFLRQNENNKEMIESIITVIDSLPVK